MRYSEKIYRQDKTNEPKNNEFRRLRQLKCECGNDSSKIYGQINIMLGKIRTLTYCLEESYIFD